MPLPRAFTTFAEFERDYLRGNSRMGLSVEDMIDDSAFEAEVEIDCSDDGDDD